MQFNNWSHFHTTEEYSQCTMKQNTIEYTETGTPVDTPTESLPYHEIGEYPGSVTKGNIIRWMIDGLGYRYYWATESLKSSDLSYRVSQDSRSSLDTLKHVFDISGFIQGIAKQAYNAPPTDTTSFDFETVRSKTLHNLKEASQLFGQMSDHELESLDIKIQVRNKQFSLPLWHLLNGPLSDAIYHIGQVVSMRRASRNPINPNVDIFMGKNKAQLRGR